jgi:hypothetical protein
MDRGMRQEGQITDKKEHPFRRAGARNNKAPLKTTPRASILFALFLIVSVYFCAAEGRPDKDDFWNKNLYKNYFDSEKDDDREIMDT